VDKKELIERILKTIADTTEFLLQHGFKLQDLLDAKDFEKLDLIQKAADLMCATLEIKKTFQTYAYELIKLFKYIDRDDVEEDTRRRKNAIVAIYEELQKKRKHADNTDLMVEINHIMNDYVTVEEKSDSEPSKQFDISKIDFDLLRKEFDKAKTKHLVIKDLEDVIKKKLEKMVKDNPTRIDFYERYQQIVLEYNTEQNSATIEKTFMELMALAQSLDAEEKRYVREGFTSDEELSVYDLLFSENLNKDDIKTIKKVAVDLLAKIKEKISEMDHWTDKQETRAVINILIRDTLWSELPSSYDEASVDHYRQEIYEYVYTRYRYVA
jgi:type I restriction enzyme R subunit